MTERGTTAGETQITGVPRVHQPLELDGRGTTLFVSNTRVAPARRAGKLLERLQGRAFDSREGIQDLETPNGVENCGRLREASDDELEVACQEAVAMMTVAKQCRTKVDRATTVLSKTSVI